MQLAIPHQLGREEVRRRLKASSGDLSDAVPGGMADIATSWSSENRMDLSISAMGQMMTGHIDVNESDVVFVIALPPALGFMEPMISASIRQQGERLLAPPRDESA